MEPWLSENWDALSMQANGVVAIGVAGCIWRYNCYLETIGWKV